MANLKQTFLDDVLEKSDENNGDAQVFKTTAKNEMTKRKAFFFSPPPTPHPTLNLK